jgi:hypothetical protein
MIGIHQYAMDEGGIPKITAEFVRAALAEVSSVKLERGLNLPARLCIVLEEAHSLIPEWNQVAQRGDEQYVNTANVTKTILNQCNTIFALQSFDQTGLDFLRNYMGAEYSEAISTLPIRHAILVGKASSSARPVLFRIDDMSTRWRDPGEPAAPQVAVAPEPNAQ